MNILFVHEVDWLEKVVFDIHFLAEAMSLLGHKVFVIDYEDSWHRRGLSDLGSLKTKTIEESPRAFSGASVSLRRPGFIKISGISRISAAVSHYYEISRTIREKKIDVIVLYSVPTNGLQTVRLARKFNIPVVFRSIDILNLLVPYPPLRPITRFLEKRVYAGVDAVIPNTPQYTEYVLDMGVNKSRVKLLPFPIDTELFHPSSEISEDRKKWGFDEKDKIIVFIGTLFNFSGLDLFISRFNRIVEAVPEAKLLVVGDGPQRKQLEEIIDKFDLGGRVIITGFQPYHTMPRFINMADVCINPFLLTEKTTDIFPAKIMQYVACGKATVATALRGITTLLPGDSHGVVYVNNPVEMVDEVISMLGDEERRQRIGLAGLNNIRQSYDYQKVSRELEAILESIIKEKRNGTK